MKNLNFNLLILLLSCSLQNANGQTVISILSRIDINKDKIISYKEMQKMSFDETELWRNNFAKITGFLFDSIVNKFYTCTLLESNSLNVTISNLAVDDDGSGPSHGDPHHLTSTDRKYRIKNSSGQIVVDYPNADSVPYIVRRGTHAGKSMLTIIKKGDFGIILFNGLAVGVASMDAKSAEGKPMAEASVRSHIALGHNPFPREGSGVGIRGSIQIIMFPGSTKVNDTSFVYTYESIQENLRKIQYDILLRK